METEILEVKKTKIKTDVGAKLVLHNDDWNSFDHVILSLIEVCQHDSCQAEQCALIVHSKGECVVKTGDSAVLEKMKNELNRRDLLVTLDKQ